MMSSDFNQMVSGASIKAFSWKDVRKDVERVNSELVKIIDSIDPGPEYRIYKAVYPYGSEVLQEGIFQLPNAEGRLVSIKDESISEQVRKDLDYNCASNPVSLLLKGQMELFLPLRDRICTFGLVSPGNLFGISFLLDNNPVHSQPLFLWGMTSGARSIFMLPKISEAIRHGYLKKSLQLSVDKPEGFMQHWEVFRLLANHPELTKTPWNCEVLFFAKSWFDQLTDDRWKPLHYYLLKEGWSRYTYLRDLLLWDCIYGLLQTRTAIRPSVYMNDLIKQVFAMGVGVLPGFAPAIDENAAPVSLIQSAYVNLYRLKDYLPVVMVPTIFDFNQPNPRSIYYSLQFHSSLGVSPKAVVGASAVVELDELHFMLDQYFEQIASGKLNIENTQVYQFQQQAQVDFFHSSTSEEHHFLKPLDLLVSEDTAFQKILADHQDNTAFPITSSFLRGCIRLSKKKV